MEEYPGKQEIRVEEIVLTHITDGGDRFNRETLPDISGLVESIRDKGLLNPILVNSCTNGLIHGESRLRALMELGYTVLGPKEVRFVEVDPKRVLELQFDENEFRTRFTPSERVTIIGHIEALRKQAHEEERERQRKEGGASGAQFGKRGAEFGGKGEAYGCHDGRVPEKDSRRATRAGSDSSSPPARAASAAADAQMPGRIEDGSEHIAYGETVVGPDDLRKTHAETPQTRPSMDEDFEDRGTADRGGSAHREEVKKESQEERRFSQKLSKTVGWDRKTFAKAEEICKAAAEDPEHYGDFKQEMDKSGEVNKVHDQFLIRKAKLEKIKYRACHELHELGTMPDLQISGYMWQAFLYLPEKMQAVLVKKYGKHIFGVRQEDYERAVKSYSRGRGITSLSEEEIYRCLEDVLLTTQEIDEQWIFQDQIYRCVTIFENVLEARGSARLQDKLEFFILLDSMIKGIESVYYPEANKQGLTQLDPEFLSNAAKILEINRMVYDSRFYTQIGAAVRRELGDPDNIASEERQIHNAMIANQNIEDAQDSLDVSLLHIRKFLQKLEAKRKGNEEAVK